MPVQASTGAAPHSLRIWSSFLGPLPPLPLSTYSTLYGTSVKDRAALADLKQQRIRVKLELPSDAEALSSRLKAHRATGGMRRDGGRGRPQRKEAVGDPRRGEQGGAREDTAAAPEARILGITIKGGKQSSA